MEQTLMRSTHCLHTPLPLQLHPPREEEARGVVASLEYQLVEIEKTESAFIWPVVVMSMISLRNV